MRLIRRKHQLTLEVLANIAGLTPNYIGTIEHGMRDPSLTTVESLAVALGVSISELFGPMSPLSEEAVEMARLFSGAPEKLQTALLGVLQVVAFKGQAPSKKQVQS